MASLFWDRTIAVAPPSSKSMPIGGTVLGVQRSPSDPFFYADVTLQNVTDGSTYRISMHNSPYTQLALGTQSGTGDIIVTSIPAYSNPMLIDVTVRNFNGSTNKYLEFNTNAQLVSAGIMVYVVQSVDPTA